MTDHEEIIQHINLYGFAIDTRRWDLFEQIFTEYVNVDFGGTAKWYGLKEWTSVFAAFHENMDSTQHIMANHQVRVLGDHAHSFTYGQWRLLRHATEGGPLLDGTGWYDDEWVRTHAGWRCRKRVSRIVWATGNMRVMETIPGSAFDIRFASMPAEAAAGSISFLKAIDAREGT
ncbi:nuclear transport factor 2 family protein [Novosphingobium sp. TH158]|uniref:nuclear transport factor 2 family protein n=1 Tax=Novosphingobium sp. TH158 TaxID=2067455 RepID=UPI000C7B93C0|nr:nuclear transport factor 2 family protein [Novosphingobium sp. TH158]PLK26514.1 nuclear transport factor 2 family protein [Novosphingobium sp. TH158]